MLLYQADHAINAREHFDTILSSLQDDTLELLRGVPVQVITYRDIANVTVLCHKFCVCVIGDSIDDAVDKLRSVIVVNYWATISFDVAYHKKNGTLWLLEKYREAINVKQNH